MGKKRTYDKYIKNMGTSLAINTGNAVGIMTTGKIGAEVPAAGAGAMSGVYGAFGVSSQLGTVNATFGKGGLMDAMNDFSKIGKKHKKY